MRVCERVGEPNSSVDGLIRSCVIRGLLNKTVSASGEMVDWSSLDGPGRGASEADEAGCTVMVGMAKEAGGAGFSCMDSVIRARGLTFCMA